MDDLALPGGQGGQGSCEGTGRATGALGGSWSLVNNNLKENDTSQLCVQCGEGVREAPPSAGTRRPGWRRIQGVPLLCLELIAVPCPVPRALLVPPPSTLGTPPEGL